VLTVKEPSTVSPSGRDSSLLEVKSTNKCPFIVSPFGNELTEHYLKSRSTYLNI
jgi:hypothetical protein